MAPDSPQNYGRTPGADGGPLHLPEWETIALDYLDDCLPPDERALVDAHLATCADCRRDLEDQRAVHAALSSFAPATPPPAIAEAVLAQLLAGGAPAETVPATGTGTRERPVSDRRRRGAFISRLLRPRVWIPAAAMLLLAAVLLSQFQPTTGGRVTLESAKQSDTGEVTTTAAAGATTAAGATATTSAGAQTQTGQTMAAPSSAPPTTSATAATVTTARGGSPPVASSESGLDLRAGTGSPLLSPSAALSGSVWIEVGSASAGSAEDTQRTAQVLASLVGAVRADLPTGATVPLRSTPLYMADVTSDVTAGLLERLAEAGLNPRVAFAPPTLDAAVRAVTTFDLFPRGLAADKVVPEESPAGVVPGGALLLVNVRG